MLVKSGRALAGQPHRPAVGKCTFTRIVLERIFRIAHIAVVYRDGGVEPSCRVVVSNVLLPHWPFVLYVAEIAREVGGTHHFG